ncbi:MAG: PDZ domain-containing protein [Ignavibacteriae bacterium]|nr:PDZ domain-containing protein [Ignavibacteriota bacterium]
MARRILSFIFLTIPLMTLAQQPTIEYTLGMSRPSTHLMEIEVTYSNLPAGEAMVDLSLPVWRSGRYVVFDFAGGIQDFSAADGSGKPLSWSKTDKTTWHIQKGSATKFTAKYMMFANEFQSRTKGLNDGHLFVDPMSSFMVMEQYRKLPLTITIKPYGSWRVTTGMDPVKGKANTFTAPSYDYFADSPIEVGTQQEWEFTVDGKKHVLMIAGEGNYEPEKMVKDLTKIVEAHKEFWGDLPYERYYFMVHMMANPSGATEHINSNVFDIRPYVFQNPNGYRGFLGTEVHEFFHTWNVKQLRPKGINPYNFVKENYTEELGISEGTTDYYTGVLMTRLGFSTPQQFLEGLANTVRGDRERPGNLKQSVSESSFDAWIKFWRNTEESVNYESDYYDKGSNVSLLLDLEIRQRSKNEHSLDDVMRTMYERFPLSGTGYTLADLQKVSEEFGGGSFQQFFEDYVWGTKPLEWEKYLAYAGLQLSPREKETKPWLGITAGGDRMRVFRVLAGSPAYEAGINVGDEVVAFNGYRVSGNDLTTRTEEMKEGEKITLTVFRDNRLREFTVTLKNRPVPNYKVEKVKEPTDLQKSIYESWLSTEW